MHPQIIALRTAAKSLQLAAWLLLTAYRNLSTPYPTLQSPTPYGQLFSQNRAPDPLTKYILPGSTVGYPSNSWASCFVIFQHFSSVNMSCLAAGSLLPCNAKCRQQIGVNHHFSYTNRFKVGLQSSSKFGQ